jgi:hypothetical protein
MNLTTILVANNGNSGNMFDIVAKKNVIITGFDIHVNNTGINYTALVYTKMGSHNGSETNSAAWNLIQNVSNFEVRGIGNLTPLPLLGSPLRISANSTWAFYITLTTTGMRYTNGNVTGALYKEDDNLQIFQGTGNKYPFSTKSSPRIWNGAIKYTV